MPQTGSKSHDQPSYKLTRQQMAQTTVCSHAGEFTVTRPEGVWGGGIECRTAERKNGGLYLSFFSGHPDLREVSVPSADAKSAVLWGLTPDFTCRYEHRWHGSHMDSEIVPTPSLSLSLCQRGVTGLFPNLHLQFKDKHCKEFVDTFCLLSVTTNSGFHNKLALIWVGKLCKMLSSPILFSLLGDILSFFIVDMQHRKSMKITSSSGLSRRSLQ